MRIIFCVRKDIKGNIALNTFLKNIDVESHEILVILSANYPKEKRIAKELVYYEFLESYLPNSHFNSINLLSELPGRGQDYYTFRQIANYYSIPVEIHGNINKKVTMERIREWSPALMISCRYDYIMKPKILEIPKFGILNVHPGVLPHYRGVLAPFYALKNGDEKLGVTVHWIDEGIDTGNILHIDYLDADPHKSVFEYYVELYNLGIFKIIDIMHQLENGQRDPGEVQGEGHYYHYPTDEEFAEFNQANLVLVNLQNYLKYLSRYDPKV